MTNPKIKIIAVVVSVLAALPVALTSIAQVLPSDLPEIRRTRQQHLQHASYYVVVPTDDGRRIECIVIGNLAVDQLAAGVNIAGNGISCNWATPVR
jgi:hypothetical protein